MTGANKNEWQNIFMVTCWHLWTWRNKRIFEEGFQRPINPIKVILKMAMKIGGCKQTHWVGWPQRTDTIYISWKCPREGWIKLNCDRAHKSSINLSGCGGLLWDKNGTFLKGYARKIGSNGNIPTLIRHIRDLENMNWQVPINHTWREGNRSADWLANFSLNFNSFDLQVMETLPRELQSLHYKK
ncbi:heat shock 70 kDa protein [Trifolium repens]|nr:heat shock 70 kDa protein [Trifolium repens]